MVRGGGAGRGRGLGRWRRGVVGLAREAAAKRGAGLLPRGTGKAAAGGGVGAAAASVCRALRPAVEPGAGAAAAEPGPWRALWRAGEARFRHLASPQLAPSEKDEAASVVPGTRATRPPSV